MEQRIRRSKPLRGEFTLPGDKSISHRALIISALADGVSEVRGFLDAGDPRSTRDCLNSLGIDFSVNGTTVRVHGKGLHGLRQSASSLNAGNSGTTMRLLSGVLAGQPFTTEITGDESLLLRPMKRIIEPLMLMGARIDATPAFTAPLKIEGTSHLRPITYALPVASAQVKSSILLAGLFADGTTTVIEQQPSRDHTERMLGLSEKRKSGKRSVSINGGARIPPREYAIPGDVSSAMFPLVAALIIPGSEILLKNVGLNPTRAAALDALQERGAILTISNMHEVGGEPIGDIHVRHSSLQGSLNLEGSRIPLLIDEIPILAVAGMFMDGRFSVRGAEELRQKESDRIQILARNLRNVGLDVEEYPDGFAFEGKTGLIGTRFQSAGDHRIAMAFAVAGMGLSGETVITEPESADISFPGFWDLIGSFQ